MTKQKANIISIEKDKEVNLIFSSTFYERINKLFNAHLELLGTESTIEAILNIKNNKHIDVEKNIILDDTAFNIETFFILIRDLENAFKEAGFTKNNEVEYEISDDISSLFNTDHKSKDI